MKTIVLFISLQLEAEELAKAETIKNKMVRNLAMARERVTDLCKDSIIGSRIVTW